MKPARIVIGLALLLAMVGGIYWLAKSSAASHLAGGTNDTPKIRAVEPPSLAPVQPAGTTPAAVLPTVVNGANATVLAANQQETLDNLLKFQTELEQSLAASTNPQERDALEHELTQLQTQIQFEIGSAAPRAVATTNLGDLALVDGHPVQRKLASGDEATFTAANNADGNWSVNIIVRHINTNGIASVESTSIVLQPGQPADIKVTGNEIHFTPQAATSTLVK